jgi:hypothetical protein
LTKLICFQAENAGWGIYIEEVGDIGWLLVNIWNNPPVLCDLQPLSGRNNYGAFVLAELNVFMIT